MLVLPALVPRTPVARVWDCSSGGGGCEVSFSVLISGLVWRPSWETVLGEIANRKVARQMLEAPAEGEAVRSVGTA